MRVIDERMAKAAYACACHSVPNGKPYGAYVRSRLASVGWGFNTFGEAFDWVTSQSAVARKEGNTIDFHAAIVTREEHAIAIW